MADLTDEQCEGTGSIIAKVHELDWNGDISPWIDSIVAVIGELVQEDPEVAEFAACRLEGGSESRRD